MIQTGMHISETVSIISLASCTYADQIMLNHTPFSFKELLCRMTDLVGFGVALATGMQYLENFPELVYKSMLIPLMAEDKRTGKTNHL